MHSSSKHSIETLAVHAGIGDDPTGAVVTPIYQTSTFRFRDVDHGARLFKGEEEGFIYTRMRNPTVEAMENAVAALEGGHKALGCASGMAAIHTVFAGMLRASEHIVCSESVYGPTATLLAGIMREFGVETTFVDTSDLDAVRGAVRPNTRMVYVETPGNPTLVMSDIAICAEIAHAAGARLVVDNTFPSPVLQRPLALGADVVVHSMTKFLNGHADVVAGIIVVKEASEYTLLRKTLNQIGGVIDPFNSFLVHRGIKTLALRMQRHNESAMKVATFLEAHAKVERVFYPGLVSHPQHELGKRQMSGPGGMISFELRGGLEAGKTMMNSVQLCQLAVSLGGVESLIQHPASMTHASMGKPQREQAKITDGLVRLSVGIEQVDEIIADLAAALDRC